MEEPEPKEDSVEQTTEEPPVEGHTTKEGDTEEPPVEGPPVEESTVKKKIPIGEYRQQMKNRGRVNRKEYRQFRKDLLDKKELELEVEISNGMNDPKNVKDAMTERGLMKTLKKLRKCMGLVKMSLSWIT